MLLGRDKEQSSSVMDVASMSLRWMSPPMRFFGTLHVVLKVGQTRLALIFLIVGNIQSLSLEKLVVVCGFYSEGDRTIYWLWSLITIVATDSAPQS